MAESPKRGTLCIKTCPFCEEVLSDWSWLLDECWKCGKSGMQEARIEEIREIGRELGRRMDEIVTARTLERILGREGERQ